MGADILRGDMQISPWDEVGEDMILDVRESFELAVENVEGAVNIPLGQLRDRLDELPKDETIHVICRSGQRAYYATRMLLQNGFKACTVSGGMLSRAHTSFFLREQ
jgi:rhodanese-related sulfurtransferase